MARYLDDVPFSGIIRIRDMMYSVERPFRLDQGDVSFDAPESVKAALLRGVAENRTHYVQTTGIPPLVQHLTEKLRRQNHIPIDSPDEVMVTSGGIHGVYAACQGLLEPGDEVLVPDPEWPPSAGNVACARAVPVPYPLHESLGWRPDFDELRRLITPKTRAIYVNSPHNPTGGVLSRADLEAIAAIASERNLWVFSDEAYEDVLYDGREQISIASLPGMYARTIPIYTFSKTYAMTGLRLGYLAVHDRAIRDRVRKILFYTVSNTSSLVQYGGVGALEGSQDVVAEFRKELAARRELFYDGVAAAAQGVLTGTPPAGAFYAFLKIDPAWRSPLPDAPASSSWAMAEFLIKRGRIGCVPGVDFGANGEGYVRFCFARDRRELEGALASMQSILSTDDVHRPLEASRQ
ncbi:MAG TPA: pyridoxal phosphate-dependent aminotransferase [Vicinamibacterales bacterium]|nr:pyridoxal phosphate-dependent aminotransferase [Vicinamibacterales bacterium]